MLPKGELKMWKLNTVAALAAIVAVVAFLASMAKLELYAETGLGIADGPVMLMLLVAFALFFMAGEIWGTRYGSSCLTLGGAVTGATAGFLLLQHKEIVTIGLLVGVVGFVSLAILVMVRKAARVKEPAITEAAFNPSVTRPGHIVDDCAGYDAQGRMVFHRR